MYEITYYDKGGYTHTVVIEADNIVQAVMRFDFDYERAYKWIKNVKEACSRD